MKTTGVIVIALAMLIALTGVVMADQVVKQSLRLRQLQLQPPSLQMVSLRTAQDSHGLCPTSQLRQSRHWQPRQHGLHHNL